MSGMMWLSTDNHCNLACSYCLTESAPQVDPRLLEPEQVLETVTEALELGFAGLVRRTPTAVATVGRPRRPTRLLPRAS